MRVPLRIDTAVSLPQQFHHEITAAAFITVLLVIAVGTAARVW